MLGRKGATFDAFITDSGIPRNFSTDAGNCSTYSLVDLPVAVALRSMPAGSFVRASGSLTVYGEYAYMTEECEYDGDGVCRMVPTRYEDAAYDELAVSFSAVPLPASGLLILFPAAALAGLSRRRKTPPARS